MTSDIVLLQRYAGKRDAEAFTELTRRYAGLVYGTCLRVLGNAADAEDVTQECFLELARNAGRVKSSLPGWLHALARSRAIDLIRKEATRRDCEQRATMPEGNSAITWKEIAPYVDKALAALPDNLRLPIILHYLQGQTQCEIAARFGTTQATISRRMERGIEELRQRLGTLGVVVSVALLTTLLPEHGITTVPAAVSASLGKMALAGVGKAAVSASAVTAGWGKILAGALLTAIVATGGVYFDHALQAQQIAHDHTGAYAVTAQSARRKATITGIYWANSPELPAAIRTIDPEYDMLIAIREWNPGEDYHQLRNFVANAAHDFLLTAPGHPSIRVSVNGGNVNVGKGTFQAFTAVIDSRDRKKLIPGVAYTPVPRQHGENNQWLVGKGVALQVAAISSTIKICGIYDKQSPGLPTWLKIQSPTELLLAIRNWNPQGDYHQLRIIAANASHSFLLTAPGHPAINLTINGDKFDDGRGMFQVFGVNIAPNDRAKLVAGATYTLVPQNGKEKYQWAVEPGVAYQAP